jgi:hypothetical protein
MMAAVAAGLAGGGYTVGDITMDGVDAGMGGG